MSGNESQQAPRRNRSPLVWVVVALIIVILVLTVMFAVPIVKAERPSINWFAWNSTTEAIGPPGSPSYTTYVFVSALCAPAGAENYSLSFVWQSSAANTSAAAYWQTTTSTAPFQITDHFLYRINDTSSGGYSFPSSDLSFFCNGGYDVTCAWDTPSPGAIITMNGEREYNYSTTVPIL